MIYFNYSKEYHMFELKKIRGFYNTVAAREYAMLVRARRVEFQRFQADVSAENKKTLALLTPKL